MRGILACPEQELYFGVLFEIGVVRRIPIITQINVSVFEVAAGSFVYAWRLKVERQCLELAVGATIARFAQALRLEEVGVANAVYAVVRLIVRITQIVGAWTRVYAVLLEACGASRLDLQVVQFAVDL